MSMVSEQFAFVQDVLKLVSKAIELGFVVTFGEAHRTPEQQAIYLKTGRSKTLDSFHLKRLAIDLNFFIAGVLCYDKAKLQPLGDYWESLSPKNRWGGNWAFKDLPHWERRA
jgi:hypothetical protein